MVGATQAIVLVGGEGSRLRPLTETVPKPALTLVDRPFLAYMIEWLARHGVEEVVLACGFLPDVLREALADEEERSGARIRYLTEPEPLGTAGAIRHAADELGESLADPFLALNGDVLTDLDLDSAAYGLVETGAHGEVIEFVEKTGRKVPGEINAGMYVLGREVLDLIPPGEKVSIEREVFPRLIGNGLHGLPLEGYWMDIGTPERYLQASWDILEGRVRTMVEPTASGVLIAAAAEVSAGAEVGPRAVVGPRCRVEEGARVSGSVLFEGCAVGAGAEVRDSILAAGVEVEAGATLAGAVAGRGERVG
jgi:mannose-1-phosphate guanylyltransferase